jgi:hypothetical protein
MKQHRFLVPLLFVLVGCESPAVDRSDDAASCLSETLADYEGKTYAEMHKALDQQDSRKYRKHGHAYEALITVSLDAENPPDRIQVDFDVFDDDDPPTMSPIKETIYLQPGESLHTKQ